MIDLDLSPLFVWVSMEGGPFGIGSLPYPIPWELSTIAAEERRQWREALDAVKADNEHLRRLIYGGRIDSAIIHAIAEERGACAKLADEVWEKDFGMQRGLERVGDYIRARSK